MENIKLLSYTHEAESTNGENVLLGFAHLKDDPDNLYYMLFWSDDYGNVMSQDLELWNEQHGGIVKHKIFPVAGETLAEQYEQVETDDATEYFGVLQDCGILNPNVYIDELVEPIETSRY